MGLTVVLISHNLSLVTASADELCVMYLGQIVEHGDTAAVTSAPAHPYTKALLALAPDPEHSARLERRRLLVPGEIPSADAGLGSGIVNVSQQMAAAVGLAVLSTVATNRSKSLVAEGHAVVGDLGCGTGQVAEMLAPFAGRVIGVESSREMVRAARTRLAGRDNVELRRGDLEALPIADATLDVATIVLVLHGIQKQTFSEI